MKYYKTYNFSRASESWSRASENWISLALRGKSLQKLMSCPADFVSLLFIFELGIVTWWFPRSGWARPAVWGWSSASVRWAQPCSGRSPSRCVGRSPTPSPGTSRCQIRCCPLPGACSAQTGCCCPELQSKQNTQINIQDFYSYSLVIQASTLTQNGTGPVGPVTPRIYWSCKSLTGLTTFPWT